MHVKGHNKRAKLNCGFTLVEIIAVIVVIVILGAVAMGIFGNMAGSAKDAVIDDFFRECQTIYATMSRSRVPSSAVSPFISTTRSPAL